MKCCKFAQFVLLVSAVCLLAGCWSKTSNNVLPDHSKKGARLVAILPVDNKTGDEGIGRMLREKILYGLYFKGYPKISFNVIDEKLSAPDQKNITPKVLGGMLNVEAVMYCTLNKCKTSYSYLWASTVISAKFELRSVQTGETLWSAEQQIGERCYSFFRTDLEMKSYQLYEPAIQEIVDSALKTFPDGPDFLG